MIIRKQFKFENVRIVRKGQLLGFFRFGTKGDVRSTTDGVHCKVQMS